MAGPMLKTRVTLRTKSKSQASYLGIITLVTADLVTLYPSIPREDGLETLREGFVKGEDLQLPVNDIVKMAEFVLKNKIFEFNGKVKQQIAGTAIGTKFAPPYACIQMDEVETEFLKTQELQPLVWFRYTDDIFFSHGNHIEDELNKFLESLNNFQSNLKFTWEMSEDINFLDLKYKGEPFGN